jgi:hypothetical protein
VRPLTLQPELADAARGRMAVATGGGLHPGRDRRRCRTSSAPVRN